MMRRVPGGWMSLAALVLTLAACGGPTAPSVAKEPTATRVHLGTPSTAPSRVSPAVISSATAPLQLTATLTPRPTAVPSLAVIGTTPGPTSAAGPSWWPGDLPMPPAAKYQGESDGDKAIPYRIAHWTVADPDLDGVRDRFVKQGQDANYTVTVLQKTNGQATYDISFLKGTRAFQLHLLGRLAPTTRVDGNALPTVQFKTTGAVSLAILLPVGNWGILPDTSMRLATPSTRLPTLAVPSQSLHITASQPNDQCSGCRNALSLTLPAYAGPAKYSAANVQVTPGGDSATGEFSNAASCIVTVKDQFNGTFDCQGLKNQADPAKTIDLSGTWQGPVW